MTDKNPLFCRSLQRCSLQVTKVAGSHVSTYVLLTMHHILKKTSPGVKLNQQFYCIKKFPFLSGHVYLSLLISPNEISIWYASENHSYLNFVKIIIRLNIQFNLISIIKIIWNHPVYFVSLENSTSWKVSIKLEPCKYRQSEFSLFISSVSIQGWSNTWNILLEFLENFQWDENNSLEIWRGMNVSCVQI